MMRALRQPMISADIRAALVTLGVLLAAAYLGWNPSPRWLALLAAAMGAVLLFRRPAFGLPALVAVALVVPLEIGTGTRSSSTSPRSFVPVLAVVWLLDMVRRRAVRLAPARANLPLLLFLAAGLLSLLIGRATWDPTVPVDGSFLLVQLAQWSIFAFSALAFWLTGNLARDEAWLQRLTATFLLLGGGVALLRLWPDARGILDRVTTIAFIRAPFWALLCALAGGQLLFNRSLGIARRAFLVAVILSALVYALVQQQEATSVWVGIGAALGVLAWLRFPRLRWPILALVVALAATGVLFPILFDLAGGDRAWISTGASRIVLIQRVFDVTMRNPLTGLGPAAYRLYADLTPLRYRGAYWTTPQINSHNNYVDLFAHGGVLGLALFAWFVVALTRVGLRLRATLQNRVRGRLPQRRPRRRRGQPGAHAVRRLDPALRLQHRLPRLSGQRAGVAVPGGDCGAGQHAACLRETGMNGTEEVVKRRALWRPGALQLLRERACAEFAGRAVPAVVDGWRIRFPQVRVSLGPCVTVRSGRLPGRSLLQMLYRPELHQQTIDVGLVVLRAFHDADITSAPFGRFGAWYDRLRGPRVTLSELCGAHVLTPEQRRSFDRLVADYIADRQGRRVLIHGDLQASHLLVDLPAQAVGVIDLEAMRVGKAATSFAQLWEAYLFADPALGQLFCKRYLAAFGDTLDDRFDADVRAELALRCYSHIRVGRHQGNTLLVAEARSLLPQLLGGIRFDEICLGEHDAWGLTRPTAKTWSRSTTAGTSAAAAGSSSCARIAGRSRRSCPLRPAWYLTYLAARAFTARDLVSLGYAVVAADASEPMLKLAAGRVNKVATKRSNIHDLTFAEGTFDATVTLRLFSHFSPEETAQALCELRRGD